jgi:hypothetical protein
MRERNLRFVCTRRCKQKREAFEQQAKAERAHKAEVEARMVACDMREMAEVSAGTAKQLEQDLRRAQRQIAELKKVPLASHWSERAIGALRYHCTHPTSLHRIDWLRLLCAPRGYASSPPCSPSRRHFLQARRLEEGG